MKLGQKVTLKKGTPVGAGKLRQDVVAEVIGVEIDDTGQPFYRVWWVDRFGDDRVTYVREIH